MTKSKGSKAVRVLVTPVEGDVASALSKVKQKGMTVHSVLDAIGVISGEIPESQLESLRSTPGVSVEEDKSVDIGPPDAPVQ